MDDVLFEHMVEMEEEVKNNDNKEEEEVDITGTCPASGSLKPVQLTKRASSQQVLLPVHAYASHHRKMKGSKALHNKAKKKCHWHFGLKSKPTRSKTRKPISKS